MGDCASRPTPKEIEEHLNENNSVNDYYFVSTPEWDLEQNVNSTVLESQRNFYSKLKGKFERGLGKHTEGVGWIPELNIEIQKGTGFESFTSCANRASPYVTLQLLPNGPQLDTDEADPFRPKWYRIFQLKQKTIHYQRIEFHMMAQKNLEVGCVSIDLTELKDQIVRDLWLTNSKNRAKVKVRIQYIHDKIMLLEGLSKECDRCIHILDSKISKQF